MSPVWIVLKIDTFLSKLLYIFDSLYLSVILVASSPVYPFTMPTGYHKDDNEMWCSFVLVFYLHVFVSHISPAG